MIAGLGKASVTACYDDDGRCRTIVVYLNDALVPATDVAAAVRAVFRPHGEPSWNSTTLGNLPQVRVNGSDVFNRKTRPDWH